MWELLAYIGVLVLSHGVTGFVAYWWTRDNYEQRFMALRYKARVLTGVDIYAKDDRWPD
jgi:hypothetical protein